MKKLILVMLAVILIGATVYKTTVSIPKELKKITSPDGKITATISKKSGNIVIESNKTNPLTVDYENNIDYGMAIFSADSRYLFVVIEKQGNGDVECRDFVENKSFNINLQTVIRTSQTFIDFATKNNITELRKGTVTIFDIDENGVATSSFDFNDQNGKRHSVSVIIDLYNQQVLTLETMGWIQICLTIWK